MTFTVYTHLIGLQTFWLPEILPVESGETLIKITIPPEDMTWLEYKQSDNALQVRESQRVPRSKQLTQV